MSALVLKSSVFEHNKKIPSKYTCDGEGINPPFTIEGVPVGTKSLALIFEDPDAVGGMFDHWVVWNISPATNVIAEDSVPGTEGLNTARGHGYYPPCPPSGSHRYVFRVYALDAELGLSANSKKRDLENAMEGHILAEGELIGRYR
jgi:Raf kinase inhibitor-like YbhB/YbcL family protein